MYPMPASLARLARDNLGVASGALPDLDVPSESLLCVCFKMPQSFEGPHARTRSPANLSRAPRKGGSSGSYRRGSCRSARVGLHRQFRDDIWLEALPMDAQDSMNCSLSVCPS